MPGLTCLTMPYLVLVVLTNLFPIVCHIIITIRFPGKGEPNGNDSVTS